MFFLEALKLRYNFLLILLQGFFLRFEILDEVSFTSGFFLQALALQLEVFDELGIGLLAIRSHPGLLDLYEFSFLCLHLLLQGFNGFALVCVILL